MSLDAKPKEVIGKKINRLFIKDTTKINNRWMAICDCECGSKDKIIRLEHILNEKTKSCGCFSTEIKKQKKVFHSGEYKLRRRLLNSSKTRANKFKIPHSIDIDDIKVPDYCPILGIKLEKKGNKPTHASPSLDRKINKLGYIDGNVFVISHRANNLKGDISIRELKNLINYMEQDEN